MSVNRGSVARQYTYVQFGLYNRLFFSDSDVLVVFSFHADSNLSIYENWNSKFGSNFLGIFNFIQKFFSRDIHNILLNIFESVYLSVLFKLQTDSYVYILLV